MKLGAITRMMLTLLLTSMLAAAFIVPPILADAGIAGLPDDYSTIQEADGDNPSNLTDSQGSFLSEGFNRNGSSFDEDRWNFNRTNEWADFAKVDGDSAELVIGVNHGKPNSYEDIIGLIDESGGNLVGTVSMGGEISAVVADIPLAAISSFVTDVRTAGLSRYIEPNMKVQACFVPNDPYWSYQWGPVKIEADYAWDTTIGDPSVLVAVIDTGIDYDHPDLAANYVPLGYDWVNNDTDPMDDHGHGTHCAGIIAAVINNSIGIAGLAQVRIMAEKGLDAWGWGTEDDLANAIVHAVDQGADILSNSWGGYFDSALIHEAVMYAYDHGVLVIAAAGNDATSMKLYPAGYDEVIAVTATDQSDYPAWFTNFGDWVELAAPGVDIYSTVWDNSYTYMSGTSMSTPHVAGVAALVWSMFPNVTRDWVRFWLRYTADDLGDPGFDVYYGYGRVNARNAVEQVPPDHDLLILDWESPPYVEPGGLGTVSTTVFNFGTYNETNITVQLFVNSSITDSAFIDFLASGESATVNCSWSPTVEGMYNVTSYVVPIPGEMVTENNVVWAYVYVGFPVKAVVLHSAGNYYVDIITNWEVLNTNWYLFGTQLIYIDYTTLNKDDITYNDIAATEADVLIISCAYDPWMGWEFTDSEIEAIKRYVYEGHGLIATAGTLYYWVPNNNKLAQLFGLNETIFWDVTGTDLLHLVDPTHPLFANVPNPFVFADVATAVPPDRRWDENELIGGTYVALGHYQESAIVVYRGLVYISPWLEIIPPYYHFHLQLLYNAITWSTYQKPEHELVVSLECPPHLEPGESTLLNATVSNIGLNNETYVELYLSIDGAVVNSTIISELLTDAYYTITYWWTPTVEATYNVTTYAPPVSGENITANNIVTKMVNVRTVKYILFDQTHGTDIIIYYSIWTASLTDRGYVIETHTTGSITPGVLAGYNVFVIPQAHDYYSSDELSAIQDFVLNGGGLLVIGDDAPYIYTDLTDFAGITWDWDGYGGYTSDITPHPVTEGVSTAYFSSPVSMLYVTSPAIDLIRDPYGYIMLAASETGGGRVLGIADEHSINDGYIHYADNFQLTNNMIDWLIVQYEHDLAVALEAPVFLELGNSSMLNATVHNRGLSNETDVELQLLINDTVVDFVVIPELLADSSYTLSYLWTPTIEGIYNVTAYALLVPGEAVTLNNVKSTSVLVQVLPNILIVNDNDGGSLISGTSLPEFESALTAAGYDYWVWSESSMGNPPLDFLTKFKLVIWTCGDYWNWAVDPTDAETLKSYLAQGGNILLEGEDIGFDHDADDFMVNVAHAIMQVDVTGAPGLTVTDPTHPVTSGLPTNFTWIIYPPYDDGVSPTNGGAEVIQYTGTNWTAVTVFEGASVGSVVYYAFPLYCLAQAEGQTLTINSVNWLLPQEHDLAVTLEAPAFLEPGDSSLLNATVYNRGVSNETDVELFLLINGTIVDNATIPELLTGSSYTLSYFWTPTVEAIYNVTAYAPPVSGENVTANNVATKIVSVRSAAKIPGDVNGDGIVDIVDVCIAALAFGSAAVDDPNTPLDETERWNPDADLNGDGIVDIVDMVIIGINFGRTA